MFRAKRRPSVLVFSFLAFLVLVPAVAAPPAAADEKNDEGYVTFAKDHPLGETRPDKSLVYVVRPTSVGFAIKSFFLCDDEVLGINRGSSYFFAHVDPGRHVFWSKSENVDALELEVEAGRNYYVQQHVRMGGFRARTRLELLDEAEGKEALAKCSKHGTLTDRGREAGMKIARDHGKDAQEDLARRARKAQEEDD